MTTTAQRSAELRAHLTEALRHAQRVTDSRQKDQWEEIAAAWRKMIAAGQADGGQADGGQADGAGAATRET